MAKCPGCKTEWFWDWENDTLKTAVGQECVSEPRKDLILFSCKDCKTPLGVWVEWESGTTIMNPPEWSDVDWDSEDHAFQGAS